MKVLRRIQILTLIICQPLLYHSSALIIASKRNPNYSAEAETHDSDFDIFDFIDDQQSSNNNANAVPIIDHILRLFRSDLSHGYNLILYGGNESITRSIREYVGQHPNYSQLITSTIFIGQQDGGGDGAGTDTGSSPSRNFKNVLSSCLQSFYTEHKTILFIQPDYVAEAKEILNEIALFYAETPSKSFTMFFFILWPYQNESSELNQNQDSLSILQNSLVAPPIASHLYIVLKENIINNNRHHLPGLIVSEKSYSRSGWIIKEYYQIHGTEVFEPVTTSWKDFFQLIKRRQDFRGITIRALVMPDFTAPQLTSFNLINGIQELRGGISYEFILPMSQVLNFTITFVRGTDWIVMDQSGKLSGMGKQLLDNEGDITLSLSELIEFRLDYLTPSHPTTEYKVNAYFQQPPRGLYRDIFYEAFKPGLWVLMVATWVLIIVCLISFSLLKRRYCHIGCSESDEMMGGGDAFCWALGAMCQTGWHYTPTSSSLQIIFMCGLVSGFVYYNAYSASIISIFSVELHRFHTLPELVDGGFKLYSSKASWTGHYHVERQAKKVGETLQSRIIDVTPVLEKIQKSRTAYVISREFFFYRAVQHGNPYNEFCEYLSELPQYIDRQYSSWYFRKFDPLKKYLDSQLTRWKEPGLIFRTNMDHLRGLPAPCDAKKKEATALEFQDVRSAFIILAAGFICSICVLISEILAKNSRNSRKISLAVTCCCQCHRRSRRYST